MDCYTISKKILILSQSIAIIIIMVLAVLVIFSKYSELMKKSLTFYTEYNIGEKITLRRVTLYTKEDSQVFGAYSHMGGKIVAFAIVNGSKEEVAKDVCMHVAAMSPKYLSKEFVDQAYLESETDIIRQEALNENRQAAKPKPEAIIEKMVEGRVNKMLKEICLVDQPFVKNPDETVGQFVKNQGCEIVLYVRLGVGEGIEKRKDDFVAEVMAAVNK